VEQTGPRFFDYLEGEYVLPWHSRGNHLAREKAYCLAVLYLKASEYTHPDKKKRPFSNVFGAARPRRP
jgi:hypothetical protein